MRKFIYPALVAGAFVLAAGAASAQDYGYGPPPGEEDITVYAPRLHVEQSKPLDGAPEKLSLSVNVRYDDLDLRSREGAHELRDRVRDSARDVCEQLRDAYPYQKMPGTSCFKDAYENAMVHANEAIQDARDDDRGYND
jgi:UrcA family protein